MTKIVLIDSGCANIASVTHALKRLGHKAILSADPDIIEQADRVILPGVGTARAAMEQLHEKNLATLIPTLTQPVMGICLGMQLLFKHSAELDTNMLGIIDAPIVKFDPAQIDIIPHMGWNNVSITDANNPLFEGLANNSHFYFVHSYYAQTGAYTIGQCDYGTTFSAIVKHKNFYGCQFHPEKSGKAGAQVLKSFIERDV
jgi:glutamine amidotransferase